MFGEELAEKFLNGKNDELNDSKKNLIVGTQVKN